MRLAPLLAPALLAAPLLASPVLAAPAPATPAAPATQGMAPGPTQATATPGVALEKPAGQEDRLSAIAAKLAGHQAVYQLTLDTTRGGDVAAARGTMTYEVDDACDAWATRQRLQMTVTHRDGQDIEMVSDYATLESKDGRSIQFRMRQTTDTAVTEQVEGEASLDRPGGTGEVRYSMPANTTKKLPQGTLFPMWHTAEIIAAAEEGKKFVSVPLFDGTGPSGAQDSTIVVINWEPPAPNKYPALASLPSGRVRVAFYDREKGAQTPDYEVGMRYWENGIANDLKMDFSDFVMNGTLSELKVPPPHC